MTPTTIIAVAAVLTIAIATLVAVAEVARAERRADQPIPYTPVIRGCIPDEGRS